MSAIEDQRPSCVDACARAELRNIEWIGESLWSAKILFGVLPLSNNVTSAN
jgi:hypothetical protein